MRHCPFPVLMFAAGFGTRMGTLTADRPKPLIEVAGRALIDHTLELVTQVKPPRIAANLHYRAPQLAAHLAPRGVTPVVEDPDILETGGGLRNALPVLGDGPVITTNTDAIWTGPNPLAALLEAWRPDVMDALLMCVPVAQAQEHSGDGDFTLAADGRLRRGPGVVYGGIQIMKTDRLQAVAARAFSLNVVWDEMLADGRLYGVAHDGKWCDVGHPGGIGTAERMIADV
ncbi:nucleotidyltransferase family protein [Sulfitobacter sp. S190]|uniref:nucleotidyltransferase family protein n=1 Tax=Sulfitobacter sp. S190 TaxID=2867022 RepID=UPI0021A73596|nr:nucleotidyltransferase family protein [Sulfitobacter sp. S190]UWR22453.1 nucleotidyltransferase family protein [Sulfitobacter sp. S190]